MIPGSCFLKIWSVINPLPATGRVTCVCVCTSGFGMREHAAIKAFSMVEGGR
jgi:hypothetical protein